MRAALEIIKVRLIFLGAITLLTLICGCDSKEKELAAMQQREIVTQQAQIVTQQAQIAAQQAEIERLKADAEASKRMQVASAESRLELAQAQGNPDEIFLSLRMLQSLGTQQKDIGDEIEKARKGIELIDSLRVAKAEHHHEDVVQIASQVLDLFPKNAEARMDLKESGLIFKYLEAGLEYQQKCFHFNEKGEAQLVGAVNLLSMKFREGEEEPTDISDLGFNMQKANELVDAALKLDPQYEEALALKSSMRQMQDAVGYVVADALFGDAKLIDSMLAMGFNTLASAMQKASESDNISPSEIWSLTSEPRKKMETSLDPSIKALESRATFLGQLQAADVQSTIGSAKEAVILVSKLKKAVFSPQGNLEDYRKAFFDADEEFSKLIDTYNSSKPNMELVNNNIQEFAKMLQKYKLFHSPNEIQKILKAHEALFTSA